MSSSLNLFLSSFTSTTLSSSASSWFNLYVTISASFMLLRTAINDLIPLQLQSFILSKLKHFFSNAQNNYASFVVTLEINQFWGDGGYHNKLFRAAKAYLPTRITHTYKSLEVGVTGDDDDDDVIEFSVNGKQEVVDEFEDMKLNWKLVETNQDSHPYEKNTLLLSFDAKHRDRVTSKYLPHILSSYEAMKAKQRNRIIEDIERFLKRKELYKKVGKPWKRGYLLYGPPGTGKSSLIAAMANYFRFDVYNLELGRVSSDSDLMRAMRDMSNRSIVVIEDIDCNREVRSRSAARGECVGSDSDGSVSNFEQNTKVKKKFTLSALLNYMDGLWSSSGEERIIVFTTNHVEKIDPALLRPGRMDMHINLSFCKGKAFRVLALNYLDIEGDHPLFQQIDGLLEKTQVTPAMVTEQLLRFENPNVVLEEFVKFLEDKDVGIGEGKSN
ncbi:AAA-ATPase [Senna tora]|uniref:AAA-ATPase n=1 Tax=Senna tora TaxID=362788 RepID=A0A834SWJ4_9FABA|nr:AAA-ATPase [Senna tora]